MSAALRLAEQPRRQGGVGAAQHPDSGQPAIEVEVEHERFERWNPVGLFELVQGHRLANLAVRQREIGAAVIVERELDLRHRASLGSLSPGAPHYRGDAACRGWTI